MSVDRRHFLLAGSAVAGGGFVSAAHAAAAVGPARSVLDFGVDPNSKADQSQALQKAIDELSAAGQPIILPAGFYRASKLALPRICSIIGIPGHTSLLLDEAYTGTPDDSGAFALIGVTFSLRASKTDLTQLKISNARLRIASCMFVGGANIAVKLDGCSGVVEDVIAIGYSNSGILADASNLTISRSTFRSCGTGVKVSSSASTIVTQNQFDACGIGVAVDGVGIVSGNIIRDAKNFGLKLGRADGKGRVVAQGNLLENCGVGIGVAASGDDIFASLNLIHGAKNGAIRAFDGDKLVGRDLARESAEMYLNLTVAGNVAR